MIVTAASLIQKREAGQQGPVHQMKKQDNTEICSSALFSKCGPQTAVPAEPGDLSGIQTLTVDLLSHNLHFSQDPRGPGCT